MASAKLVNHHHLPTPHHHSLISRHHSPSSLRRASTPSSPHRLHNSPDMTLDYSLPRGRDLETGSPPTHGLDPDPYSHPDKDCADLHKHSGCHEPEFIHDAERNCPGSPLPPPHSPEDRDSLSELSARKNKRKLSSPRRRADVPDDEDPVKPTKKKKLLKCSPVSPLGEDEDSGIDSYKSVDDTILDVVGGAGGPPSPSVEKANNCVKDNLTTNPHKNALSISKHISDVPLSDDLSSNFTSSSQPKAASSSSRSKSRKKSSNHNRLSSTSSHPPSVTSSSKDTENGKQPSLPAVDPHLPIGLQANFLHPMLASAGVPSAAALGLMPGLYFGGGQHPGLHPSISMLPPHFQHAYIAAAAAAAAHASSLAPTTASSSSSTSINLPSTSSTLSSTPQALLGGAVSTLIPSMLYPGGVASTAKTTVSESRRQPAVNAVVNPPPAKSSSRPSKLQRHQRQSSSSSSSPQPQPQQPTSSSSTPQPAEPSSSSFPRHLLQPSSSSHSTAHYPGLSSSASVGDPNDSSSSRPQSPEDLSMPGGSSRMSRKHRKNYKNMTRERRVEANARERTRVHTISAAFEALRRAVPSYSHNQKLSKLAILRIACSYIMSLARLGDMDYTSASEHIGQPLDFSECVEMTTNTIQTEGRARRRH